MLHGGLLKLKQRHLKLVLSLLRRWELETVLEGDSLIIVQALKQVSNAPSTIFSLIYEMIAECNEFRKVSFSHVKWQGSRPAHLLAKQALGFADFSAWIEGCPCFLEQALVHDISVSLFS